MKLLIDLLNFLWEFIRDANTLDLCRLDESAFIRSRKLSFTLCLIIGLTHFTVSMDFAMDEFFTDIYQKEPVVLEETVQVFPEKKKGRKKKRLNHFEDPKMLTLTGSAYVQAREKFDHRAYEAMFIKMRDMIDHFYRETESLKTKYSLQILAVDGSRVNLPKKKDLFELFGGGGRNGESPLALMTLIYDSLNDIIYETVLGPYKETGERAQAQELISKMATYMDLTKVVFIFDRGYYSKAFVDFLDSLKTHYIFRLKSSLTFLNYASIGDNRIEIYPKVVKRIIKLPLEQPNGNKEIEALLTNWNEPEVNAFKELYFLRWPVEVEIDTLKNKIEMPNFNGYLVNSIYQDFWISMVIANLISVILKLADKNIHNRHRNHKNKFKYQANISETANALHIWLPKILLDENQEKIKKRIPYLINYASQSEEPVIPNRSVPRNMIKHIKYHYSRKHH